MRRTYPLLRLSPEAAGILQRDHDRATKKLKELERYQAEFLRRLRVALGIEAVWALQRQTRNALLLQDLQKEAPACN
ncbi:hypothetical protein D9M70_436460 [compost metagenome]